MQSQAALSLRVSPRILLVALILRASRNILEPDSAGSPKALRALANIFQSVGIKPEYGTRGVKPQVEVTNAVPGKIGQITSEDDQRMR